MSISSQSDPRAVVVTRIFDVPRERVFAAWTDPRLMARWWGPKNTTNPVCELEARHGGAIHIEMRGPDGTITPLTGVIHDITTPERLVFTSVAESKDGDVLIDALTTATFAGSGGRTRLAVRASAVALHAGGEEMLVGMETDWSESLDRLQALVIGAGS